MEKEKEKRTNKQQQEEEEEHEQEHPEGELSFLSPVHITNRLAEVLPYDPLALFRQVCGNGYKSSIFMKKRTSATRGVPFMIATRSSIMEMAPRHLVCLLGVAKVISDQT